MSDRPCVSRPRDGSTRLVVLLGVVLGGCGRSLCVGGPPDVGETVRVTIIEPWDAESQFPWDERTYDGTPEPERPDLGPGSAFLIRIDEFRAHGPAGCEVRYGTPRALAGVAFEGKTERGGFPGAFGAEMVRAKQRINFIGGACRGNWSIGIGVNRSQRGPFDEPVPGESPNKK
jgi:hypothetical protein